jgi:hypothetical protein
VAVFGFYSGTIHRNTLAQSGKVRENIYMNKMQDWSELDRKTNARILEIISADAPEGLKEFMRELATAIEP